MSIQVSPLDLLLDESNPRFATANVVGQDSIRKYMVVYEDVVKLATDINRHGGLMPGERIVILDDGGQHVVVEGNRRTCSLQMLLSRDLIPAGFEDQIPVARKEMVTGCSAIEVDVLPDRNAALELMAERHIGGVQQWKPIAKKRFFAANFELGQTVKELSERTGIASEEIRQDIRQYKFFLMAYELHGRLYSDFDKKIVDLKIEPFLRIFHAIFSYCGKPVGPVEFLRIGYDKALNTTSSLSDDLFKQIVALVFHETAIGNVSTRQGLANVAGINPLLDKAFQELHKATSQDEETGLFPTRAPSTGSKAAIRKDGAGEQETVSTSTLGNEAIDGSTNGTDASTNMSSIPESGGPSPDKFFESISWNRLDKANPDHQGLIVALHELHEMSIVSCGRNKEKGWQTFPVAAGMVLRMAYEQSLILRLSQVKLWDAYEDWLKEQRKRDGLANMEEFVAKKSNESAVLPDRAMVSAFNRVRLTHDRDFLNANAHNPGQMRVTSSSLESLAQGGLLHLIQRIVSLAQP
jgi:hypothetical protein